jgi:hypothetical protein
LSSVWFSYREQHHAILKGYLRFVNGCAKKLRSGLPLNNGNLLRKK